MAEPGFWDVNETARKTVDQLKVLRSTLEPWAPYEARVDDAVVLLDLAVAENDEAALAEVDTVLDGLKADAERLELQALLSGPRDAMSAFLTVQSGAGGVEFVLLEGFGRPCLREQVPAGLLEEVIAWLSAE